MLNILLAGVGGQGTVLAAKVLAQAAQEKGWKVRTAETIGMAQRGGNVSSHVRMGNLGEPVFSSLVPKGSANMIIAFEPAEAAGVLPYLAPDGMLVSASTGVQPVTAALSKQPYRAEVVIEQLRNQLHEHFVAVDDAELLAQVGSTKVLKVVLLAQAIKTQALPLGFDDLRAAVKACVKPQFAELNFHAIDVVERR